jgi:hypothetical protein
MARRAKKEQDRRSVSSKKNTKREVARSHEFETMSQIQNRYGNGRERSGSDGGSNEGRGSNH